MLLIDEMHERLNDFSSSKARKLSDTSINIFLYISSNENIEEDMVRSGVEDAKKKFEIPMLKGIMA